MDSSDRDLPNAVPKCAWSANAANSPHHHESYPKHVPKILPDILSGAGNTPMVRINRLGKENNIRCEIVAKCEFLNPGGSVKDRIATRMVENAEREGILHPGMTLIEPTSGNTGIGVALVAAVKGYKCIICMPEKMSAEKANVIKALGAQVVRTPTLAGVDDPESHYRVAKTLKDKIPGAFIPNQYANPYNSITHYDITAQEIIDQCDGKLDMVVMGAGTGGTITGVGRRLKELCPNVKIVGADPVGSVLAKENGPSGGHSFYEIEGIGYDFAPTVLDMGVVDQWIKTNDKDSFVFARKLILKEGLLVGGSSGAAMCAAIQAAKDLREDQRCVVILPDGVRNYMTKFLCDDWMKERDYIPEESHLLTSAWWYELPAKKLPWALLHEIDRFIDINRLHALINCPDFAVVVTDKQGAESLGIMSRKEMMNAVACHHKSENQKIDLQPFIHKNYRLVNGDDKLKKIYYIMQNECYVVGTKVFENADEKCLYLISREQFLHFISSGGFKD